MNELEDGFFDVEAPEDLDKFAFKFAKKILSRGVLGTPSHLSHDDDSDLDVISPYDMTLTQEVDINLRNLNNALYKLQLQAGEAAAQLQESTKAILDETLLLK
jgi:hypothetical protein